MDRQRFFQLLAPVSLAVLAVAIFVKAESATTPATAGTTIVEPSHDQTGPPGGLFQTPRPIQPSGFPNSSAQRLEQAVLSQAILRELVAIRQQLERGAVRVDLDVEALAAALGRLDDTAGGQTK